MPKSDKKSEQFFILDGTGFAYRSFFAIGHLSNSRGIPTNAVFGFARTLGKILQEHRPDYIAVSFDMAGPTFRHDKFKDYKAQRPNMPDELAMQLPLLHELLEAYNIPILELQGYEADDIMGTMVQRAKARGIASTIMTSDKDMMQLVGKDVRVMSAAKEAIVYDEKAVEEKFGVGPSGITQLLALTGDSSDNIAGVPGVGPKTASRLMQQFGSLEGIYGHLEDIKSPKLREGLAANKERVRANLELVRVDIEVPVATTIEECRVRPPDKEKLVDLFKRLEFGGLLKEFVEPTAGPTERAVMVQTPQDLAKRMQAIAKAKECIFDLVTTSLHPMQADILGAVFHAQSQQAFYVALGKKLSLKDFLANVKGVLTDPSIGKVGHDLKYDAVVLLRHGIELRGISFDTMLASYLLNPSRLRHGLGELALEFLSERMKIVADVLGKGKTARAMTDIPSEELSQYACAEALVIAKLRPALQSHLETKQLGKLFHEVEIPLELVLAKMEHAGMAVDPLLLSDISKECENQIEELTRRIHSLAGEPFNIASTKALGHILFEKLKLAHHRKTKTGYSTDVDVLTSLAKTHELPLLVLHYRTLSKLKSTYSDALPTLIHQSTGRIHTSFNQTVAATGRLSSSDPNLQNIPVRTPLGLRIREAFIPGHSKMVLLGADYSQIELRILSHLSGDKNLLEAFRGDLDVHRHTAGLVFGVDPEKVTDDQRRKAKIVNFGILYGMGAFSLAKDMEVTQAEAQDFIHAYFQRYDGVQAFIQKVLEKARRERCVTTLLGRCRYLPEIASSNFAVRQFAERMAVNTAVQGTAADIIKMAMLRMDEALSKKGCEATMLLQIHDELVFEVARTQVNDLARTVRQEMEQVVKLDVPLKVDIKVGDNWAQL